MANCYRVNTEDSIKKVLNFPAKRLNYENRICALRLKKQPLLSVHTYDFRIFTVIIHRLEGLFGSNITIAEAMGSNPARA